MTFRPPQNRDVSDATFFVTTNLKDRAPLFRDSTAAQLVVDSLQFFRRRREVELYGFVVMPNHVHVVVRPLHPLTLPAFVRRLKTHVAHALGRGPIWQQGYISAAMYNEHVVRQKLEYMHMNPVRAGLVARAEDCRWSSAAQWHRAVPDLIDDFTGSPRVEVGQAEPAP